MRAWLVRRESGAHLVDVPEAELGEGDVAVDIQYSSVNYKDGLALRGDRGVVRIDPLIPGIDLVGTVAASDDARFAPGDAVLVNGWGIGETHHGGYAERAHVEAGWLTRLPEGIDARRAAAIGTAGFTAALAVLAIGEPEGPVLVTGAAGGVGSIAIALLAALGHEVVASTGRLGESDYLRRLGAHEIVERSRFSEPGKPLQGEAWAAAIDSVGGVTLATVLAQTRYRGTVAACGLAGGAELPTTVMPFILRGVTLAGINSVYCPAPERDRAWRLLAERLDLDLLDSLTSAVPLERVPDAGARILEGHVRGRTVVEIA